MSFTTNCFQLGQMSEEKLSFEKECDSSRRQLAEQYQQKIKTLESNFRSLRLDDNDSSGAGPGNGYRGNGGGETYRRISGSQSMGVAINQYTSNTALWFAERSVANLSDWMTAIFRLLEVFFCLFPKLEMKCFKN